VHAGPAVVQSKVLVVQFPKCLVSAAFIRRCVCVRTLMCVL
jgi:hypothetical protein